MLSVLQQKINALLEVASNFLPVSQGICIKAGSRKQDPAVPGADLTQSASVLMKLVTPMLHTARLSLPRPLGVGASSSWVEQVNNVTTSERPHFTQGRNDSLGREEVED